MNFKLANVAFRPRIRPGYAKRRCPLFLGNIPFRQWASECPDRDTEFPFIKIAHLFELSQLWKHWIAEFGSGIHLDPGLLRPAKGEERQPKRQQRYDHGNDHPVGKIRHDNMIVSRFERTPRKATFVAGMSAVHSVQL